MRFYYLLYAALVLVLAACFSACKKDSSASDDLPCPAANSRLLTKLIPKTSGDSTLNFDEDGLRPKMVAVGPDSVVETFTELINYYIFNSAGDHIRTRQFYPGSGSRQSYFYDFYYEYDAGHRLIRSWSHYNSPYFNPGFGTMDSVVYRWENGNMVESRNLISGQSTTYKYHADGRGQNPDNIPEVSARWLFRRNSNVVLSKDYVQAVGNVRHTPTYDKAGRLVNLRTQGSTPINPEIYSYNIGYVYTCR